MSKQQQNPQGKQQQDAAITIPVKLDLITMTMPASFPFVDLLCQKEHKALFEKLFKPENSIGGTS